MTMPSAQPPAGPGWSQACSSRGRRRPARRSPWRGRSPLRGRDRAAVALQHVSRGQRCEDARSLRRRAGASIAAAVASMIAAAWSGIPATQQARASRSLAAAHRWGSRTGSSKRMTSRPSSTARSGRSPIMAARLASWRSCPGSTPAGRSSAGTAVPQLERLLEGAQARRVARSWHGRHGSTLAGRGRARVRRSRDARARR